MAGENSEDPKNTKTQIPSFAKAYGAEETDRDPYVGMVLTEPVEHNKDPKAPIFLPLLDKKYQK
jgi:hypothetical protein